MNFKKIFGSLLSAMTLFSTSPVMAYDVIDETSLNEFMTKADYDKQTGVIKNNITTTVEHSSANEDVRFLADGDRILSGSLLRFTNMNGRVTLSLSTGSSGSLGSLTINNDISLEGTTLSNDKSGVYNFGNILGTGVITLTKQSTFTAKDIEATSLSLRDGSTLTLNAVDVTDLLVFGSSTVNSTLEAKQIEANKVTLSNNSVANVEDTVVTGELSVSGGSTFNAVNNASGKNTGKITATTITIDNSKIIGDIITANDVSLKGTSSIDLVADAASGYSANGVLTVSDTLDISADSSVKANSIEANKINALGKIFIGKDGDKATVKTDSFNISKGEFKNIVVNGKSGKYSDIKFAAGGSDISFEENLNQLHINGGSTSLNAKVDVMDSSSLDIFAGVNPKTTDTTVVFDGTNFNIGNNSNFNLNAESADIEFKGNVKNNIELANNAKVSVTSSNENTVIFNNINYGTKTYNGSLNINENSNAKIAEGSQLTGQIYVDKFSQDQKSTFTMSKNSTLNANKVVINEATLNLDNVPEGIHTTASFNATKSNINNTGHSKIFSDDSLILDESVVNIAQNSSLSIGANTQLDISGDSKIITDGELRFFGDTAAPYNLNGEISNGDKKTGTLRKVGESVLNIGSAGAASPAKNIQNVIIGIDKNYSTSKETLVGSGKVNIYSSLPTNSFIVGASNVVLNEEVNIGNGLKNSEIRFKNSAEYGEEYKSELTMSERTSLSADKIELSSVEATIKGGTIGGTTDGNSSEVIFGDGSKIKITSTPVHVKVNNGTTGGFKSQGSVIEISGAGSLIFDIGAVGSQAHWSIETSSQQYFDAGSWFDGVLSEHKIKQGGAFYNSGSLIIGDNTTIGFAEGVTTPFGIQSQGNNASEKGGALYNVGYFGSRILGEASSNVLFGMNKVGEIEKNEYNVPSKTSGEGGAIYNAVKGIVSLGTSTIFRDNVSLGKGGAVYNSAGDSVLSGGIKYKSFGLGNYAFFDSNIASASGGAIYAGDSTAKSTTFVGDKSAFQENFTGLSFDETSGKFKPNSITFYSSQGGAITASGTLSSVEIGAHSGFFDNFSSYSGSAISNIGSNIVFADDGKIGDEPAANGKIVAGAVKFYQGGYHKEENTIPGMSTPEVTEYYTHQGGAIYNNNGKFSTKMSDGSIKDAIYNAEFEENKALFGGAIYNYSTTPLTVEKSTFKSNSANRGIEIFKDFASTGQNVEQKNSSGGAIYNAGRNTSYTLKDDTSTGLKYAVKNVAYNNGSKLNLLSSTFTSNTASDKAGAVYNDVKSQIEMSDVKFDSNSATQGGAVYNAGSEEIGGETYIGATIYTKKGEQGEKIVFSNNTATRQMKGKDQTSPTDEYLGGALYNAGTIKDKSVTATTFDNELVGFDFTNNTAGAGKGQDANKDTIGRGGAFYNASAGTTNIKDSVFSGNRTYAYTKNTTDADSYKAEGGAIYNEKGTLTISENTIFENNGKETSGNVSTGKGGAIYNAKDATTIIDSKDAIFSGNAAISKGGAIYNEKDAKLELKNEAKIGVKDANYNESELGGGIYNAGILTTTDKVSFINNKAQKGGGLYISEGSGINKDLAGMSHISNLIFDGNSAAYGAGSYIGKNIEISVDNTTFNNNVASVFGSGLYNEGKLTLGKNNLFSYNTGSLVGNSGELTLVSGFVFDGATAGNEGNTSFIANEKDGILNLITSTEGNRKSAEIKRIGNGTENGAAISLHDNSMISTDGVANTLKNATFTENKGQNGGAIYKNSTEDLTIDNTKFEGNIAENNGGAIFNAKGNLTIGENTEFVKNSSVNNGGAIFNAENATISFAEGYSGFSTISGKGNYSESSGGAIANEGLMKIYYDTTNNTNSIIFAHQGKDVLTGEGGALYLGKKAIVKTNDISKLDSNGYEVGYIKNAVFSNNSALSGGAIVNESNLIIEDTVISNNISGDIGGAIVNRGSVVDDKKYGNLQLILSEDKTLFGNKADNNGGAIFNENGTVTISAKEGEIAVISNNMANTQGGVISSFGEDGVISIEGNVKFKDNGTIGSDSTGGVIAIAEGTLNLDTTKGDILFENNKSSYGSAIYAENGATINFKGDENHGIKFTKDQTIVSDNSAKLNKINVLGSNVDFESSLSDFYGQYTQSAGTVKVSNDFVSLQGTHNDISGGTFILTEGAKLATTDDTLGNNLNINGATIRFENNSASKLTDMSLLYQYKDATKNPFSNVGSKLTYTSNKGDAKIALSEAKMELALKQKFVDVVDEKTGEHFKQNSGVYDLVLSGGADKNIDIANDGRHAVSDLVLGDAVQVATDIKVTNGGKLSLEGAGLAKDKTNYVKKIELASGGRLNIFNDTYETTVGGVKTKYNTDLTFYGELVGDASSIIYKGYKTSPTEDGLAGRASLTFGVLKDENGTIISAASAENYLGKYTQNAGTLEFESGSTYFNHTNSQISYLDDAKLILNDGVIYTGNTTIDFGGTGGKFVLGSATNIDMTNPDEKIEFVGKDKDGNDVQNTVNLGTDTTVQVTHGETGVDASDDTINIGKDNAFSGLIVGGEESKNDNIKVTVNTVGIEGADTKFTVEEGGKLGFGDVKFVDTAGNDATNYSPTVTLGKNAELLLVSERNNDFNNLNLSTDATAWSQTSGSLIKENASKTTLTGEKTDLSDFHGTIVIKNGEIALGNDIADDKKFASDTHFDLSKIENGASINVTNITQGNDMLLLNGIGNEIIGTPTGEEKYIATIKNDKGSVKFIKEDGTVYTPDVDVVNGSFLKIDAKGDIEVNDVNVKSKFSSLSGEKQESQVGLISQGNVTTGELNVIGKKDGTEVSSSTLYIEAKENVVATGNAKVEDGSIGIKSQDGAITFGDVTDTVNPALNVVNGKAEIVAKDALTINGKVKLDTLTANSILEGSTVSMGGVTVSNSTGKNVIINASTGKASIDGDATFSDVNNVILSAKDGIDINAEGTEKGNLSVTNAILNATTSTGNVKIDGNIAAENSTVNIFVTDTGVGDITIGNNTATIPALSAANSTVLISSEGATTLNGSVLLDNLTGISGVGGKSLTMNGDLSVTNNTYETKFIAEDGGITVGAINLENNKLPDGTVVKTTISAQNGDINATGKLNVDNAEINITAAGGGVSIASGTTGSDMALKVNEGKVNIIADNAMNINGNVEMSALKDVAALQASSISAGKLDIHDNNYNVTFISTVGDISTKDIKVINNNEKLTNIQSAGGITTNNGNVDVVNSNLQLVGQNGGVNLGTGVITIDNAKTVISATNGGITSGDVILQDSVGGNLPTSLVMSAEAGNIKSGNINLSNNVVLTQKTTNSGDITNGSINVADSSSYSAISAGKYTADNITANVIEGSNSIAVISAVSDIVVNDVTASNLSDMYIRTENGNIEANDVTLSKVAVSTLDGEGNASVIMSDNGAISIRDLSLTDMATNPTYVQAKNDINTGAISLANASSTILSENKNISASGNVKVVDSDLKMQAGEAITMGDAADLVNPALKVQNGSAVINAQGGALTINGDVDMTAVTADAFMQGTSVAMKNLNLYENTKDTYITATNGDISINSVTLTNNKETVGTETENKTIGISATNGGINVQENIKVTSSNMTMVADGNISAKDLTVTDSKIAPATEDDPYSFGTVISTDTGNVSLDKILVTDSVVGVASSTGDIDIDKSIVVANTSSTTHLADNLDYLQTIIQSESGNVSIGSGLTAPVDGSAVSVIKANMNTYVEVQGQDVNIGNNTVTTEINANGALFGISAGNNLLADKTNLIVTDSIVSLEAGNDLSIGSVSATTSIEELFSENPSPAQVSILSNGGKITINGDVKTSIASLGIESDRGVTINGQVDLKDSEAAIVSTGDVSVAGKVSFKNTPSTTSLSNRELLRNALATSRTQTVAETERSVTAPQIEISSGRSIADIPMEALNNYISQAQQVFSDVDYGYTIDGLKVTIGDNFSVDNSAVAIGGNNSVTSLKVQGATDLDNSVVMINSSGDVVTNGLSAKDSLMAINASKLKTKNLSVSATDSSGFLSYMEMVNGNIEVTNNMTMKNAILNANNTNNITVGGAGNFNKAVLNIPNANAKFNSLKTADTMVNLSNNKAENTITVTGDYNVSGNNLYYMDFDPATGKYDKLHADGAITGSDGATITVNSTILNKGDIANGYQVYDVFSANNGVSNINFGLQGDTAYTTTLANYRLQSLGSGKYAFRRTGYTPTALVNPVAIQVGGFLTQVQTYDTAFDNLDMVMMLPMTAYGPNRYAVSEEDAMVYSPLFIPELEKGIWFRPFANFENIEMSQVGDDISSQTYGALVGGDTALKDLGNGYQGMMSAYVGYTGSHQDLDGVSNYQNGGVVGVTGAIYKNGFFSGLTVSANASGNSASTPVGDNDFLMLTAGVASKTGYNWEIANGKFIIQPSWLMSYTFSDIFNEDDIAGMKLDVNALHAVQLAPGLKLIGNFSNGWQPYLTVDYRFNLADKTDYRVGVVDLPDAKVKSYIEYGVGMQKRWGDRFTGFGQFLGRGIGRNGVGLNLGMRWMVGNGRNPR